MNQVRVFVTGRKPLVIKAKTEQEVLTLAHIEMNKTSKSHPKQWCFMEVFNDMIKDWVPHSSRQSCL